MKVGFIQRTKQYATSFLNDSSLLKRIMLKIKEKGVHAIALNVTSRDLHLNGFSTDLDGLCSMARDPLVLSLLSVYRLNGVHIINDPHSVKKCMDRAFLYATLSKEGLKIPPTHICFITSSPVKHPIVLKKVLLHNGVRGKGVIITSNNFSWQELKRNRPLIVQKFVDATFGVKAYVIGDDVSFKRMQLMKGPRRLPMDLTLSERRYIRETSIKCGELFNLDIFNVEFLQTDDGLFIVDVNDFPSFSGIPNAEEKIASYLLRSFKH